MSPVASDNFREVLSDTNPIVSQWQHLASTDRQSPRFLSLLSSLTAQENRSSTINLSKADAEVTLNIIDQVFRDGKIPKEHTCDIIYIMRKLAYNSGKLPARYQVNRESLSVETAVIACGAFADVRKGTLGDKVVAIRTLRISQQTDKNESEKLFCKESITWMNLSHPNILKLIGVDIDPLTGRYLMISEFMVNGNIRSYIRHHSANRHRLLEEAAAGLRYLHQYNIVHGDLKGNNILITNETPPRACLADFGLSTLTPSTQGATTTLTAGGTPTHMAPQLLLPKKFNNTSAQPTKPADIYAFGMVIFEVLTGFQPFYDRNWQIFEMALHVLEGARPTKPDNLEQIGFGGGTWELVEECWIEDPKGRPTIEQVLTHLTRVAATSTVVGPTPELVIPRNPHEFDSSCAMILPQQRTASLDDLTVLADQFATDATIGTVSAASVSSKISTSSNSTLGSSGNNEGSHRDVDLTIPSKSVARPLPKSPVWKLPSQPSKLSKRIVVKPEMVLNSTIPLPIFFAKKPSTFDRLVRRRSGLFDDLRIKSKRTMDPSTSPLHWAR